MDADTIQISDLQLLRTYVHENLCCQNELEIGAFPMSERILVRAQKPCGIYFCLHGPRSVKLVAIWETDCNTILFYGSGGERLAKTQLTQAPCLTALAAA